jgi:chorismate mutase
LNLEEIRKEIEEIDARILELIVHRVSLAQKVLLAKQELGLPIDDQEQNERVLGRATELAVESGLDIEPVRDIFDILIIMNQERQHKLRGELGIG